MDPLASVILPILEKSWLSERDYKTLSHAINEHKQREYPSRRLLQPNRLRQNLDAEELAELFGFITSPDDKKALALIFAYGLRIGELRGLEYHEPSNQLRIHDHKNNRYETLPVYESARELTKQAVRLRISPDGLRRRFSAYARREPRFCYDYATSIDGRRLAQFSSKTLRKSAIQFVYEETRDPILAARFSRHDLPSRFGQLGTYVRISDEALLAAMERSMGDVLQSLL